MKSYFNPLSRIHVIIGELQQVYLLPNITASTLLQLRIVPLEYFPICDESSDLSVGIPLSRSSSSLDDETQLSGLPNVLPGFLVLSKQSYSSDLAICDNNYQQLNIVPSPFAPISNWNLDLGTAPEILKVSSIQPGTAMVTCLNAAIPTTLQTSIVSVLMQQSTQTDTASKPPCVLSTLNISSRYQAPSTCNQDDVIEKNTSNGLNLVLSTGSPNPGDAIENKNHRPQDIVFVGYDDGTVICWGVSRPQDKSVDGRGNIWLPLICLKNGDHPINVIELVDTSGLLIIGDDSGRLIIWEVFDADTNVGFIQYEKYLFKENYHQRLYQQDLLSSPDSTIHYQKSDDLSVETSAVENNSLSVAVSESDSDANCIIFKPTQLRLFLNLEFYNQITQVKFIDSYSLVVVGTANGTLYTLALYEDTVMPLQVNLVASNIPGLSSIATSGSVMNQGITGLWLSTYYKLDVGCLIPAVYVNIGVSHIIVLNPVSNEILSYCIIPATETNQENDQFRRLSGSNNSAPTSTGIQLKSSVAFGCVLDSNETAVSIYSQEISPTDIILSTVRQGSQFNLASSNTKKSTAKLFSSSAASTPVVDSRNRSTSFLTNTSPVLSKNQHIQNFIPPEAPKTLILLLGRKLFRFNIQKFLIPKKSSMLTSSLFGTSSGNTESLVSGTAGTLISSKVITLSNIISGCLVNYVEEKSRAWSQPLPCLLAINSEANTLVINLIDKSAIGHVALFERVLTSPLKITTGIALQNGNSYFSHNNGTIIYSGRPISMSHILTHPLPSKAIYILPHVATINSTSLSTNTGVLKTASGFSVQALQLQSGREKPGQKKKRQSLMAVAAAAVGSNSANSSTITDLDKIFLKTKEKRDKEELFNNSSNSVNSLSGFSSDDDMSDTSSNSSRAVASSNNSIANTKAVMNETKQLFLERGEKLEQINVKSDELKNMAFTYHETAKATKDQLKKKQNRWGLF